MRDFADVIAHDESESRLSVLTPNHRKISTNELTDLFPERVRTWSFYRPDEGRYNGWSQIRSDDLPIGIITTGHQTHKPKDREIYFAEPVYAARQEAPVVKLRFIAFCLSTDQVTPETPKPGIVDVTYTWHVYRKDNQERMEWRRSQTIVLDLKAAIREYDALRNTPERSAHADQMLGFYRDEYGIDLNGYILRK